MITYIAVAVVAAILIPLLTKDFLKSFQDNFDCNSLCHVFPVISTMFVISWIWFYKSCFPLFEICVSSILFLLFNNFYDITSLVLEPCCSLWLSFPLIWGFFWGGVIFWVLFNSISSFVDQEGLNWFCLLCGFQV